MSDCPPAFEEKYIPSQQTIDDLVKFYNENTKYKNAIYILKDIWYPKESINQQK